MIPKFIHQIWLGPQPLRQDFIHYREKLMRLNRGFEHMQWDEAKLKGVGFDCAIAATKFPTWAGVSNAARLYILRRFGGWYFDHDYLPLKPIGELCQMGTALAAEQRDGRICNSFMASLPNHEWIARQCDLVGEYEGQAAFWGVDLASRVSREGLTLLSPRFFYPYFWDDPEEKRQPHPDTYMLHLWDASWVPKHS